MESISNQIANIVDTPISTELITPLINEDILQRKILNTYLSYEWLKNISCRSFIFI
jgi:hypothetical protein